MSAINLRSVKREFAQLNYRPEVCHSNLVDELKIILECTGKLAAIRVKLSPIFHLQTNPHDNRF